MKTDLLKQGGKSVCLDVAKETSVLFLAAAKQENLVTLKTCLSAGLLQRLLFSPVTVTMHLLAWGLHQPRKSLYMLLTEFAVCACMHTKLLNHVRLFVTLWAVAHQAPLSMGFSRQEYWSALPCPRLGNLPDPGIKPMSLTFPVWAGGFFTTCQLGSPSNLFTS